MNQVDLSAKGFEIKPVFKVLSYTVCITSHRVVIVGFIYSKACSEIDVHNFKPSSLLPDAKNEEL